MTTTAINATTPVAPEIAAPTKPKRERKAKAEAPATTAKPKRPTVGERLETMLRRPTGATLAEVMGEFGILAHSARAVISVQKRRRGLDVHFDRKTGRYALA
ncbi:hypothetical protein ATER59S_01686 [Aquamicrobium terrae]